MKFNQSGGIRYLTFDIFPPNVKHGIFTRAGGISVAPWKSLNVGGSVGDDAYHVRANRNSILDVLERDRNTVIDVWQVHSADVVVASSHSSVNRQQVLKADAIITDNPSLTLLMRFADCTPVLLYDPKHNAIGIVHSGWVGTVKRAAGQAVKMMSAAYGSKASDVCAAIGPAIGPDHYEVGANVIEHVNYAFGLKKDSVLISVSGKTHFDLWAANRIILEDAGVGNIETSELCTACNVDDWFSHRAEKGNTGRFGAIIGLV